MKSLIKFKKWSIMYISRREIIYMLKKPLLQNKRRKKIPKSSVFKSWLLKRKESAACFSRRSHISYLTILKAYAGKKVRIDTARRIVRYSNKELKLSDFGYKNY